MKKLAISCLALLSLSANARPLHDFKHVAFAVSEGRKLTFVVDLKKCTGEGVLGPMTASVNPKGVLMLENNKIIATSEHFRLNNGTDQNTPVFDFIQYTINYDGKTTVKMNSLNATDYSPINTYSINCELDQGFKVFA